MATNYPSSLDNSTSLPYPTALSDRNSPSLAGGQDNQNDALIAIETLVGTNASQTDPASQYNVLQASSASASTWAKLTSNNVSSATGSGSFVFGTSPTISSPTISGGTIDNSSITVDSIAGHTTSNTGTIYGISIASGILSSPTIHTPTLTGTTTAGAITSGAITSSGIIKASTSNPVWQYLGYAQITGNITTTSTSTVQATGLSVTVTVPTGYTKVRITFYDVLITNSSSSYVTTLSVWRGTVGSGTQVQQANSQGYGVNNGGPVSMTAYDTPTAGSVTYNIGWSSSNAANTSTITAGSTFPAFIAVECC